MRTRHVATAVRRLSTKTGDAIAVASASAGAETEASSRLVPISAGVASLAAAATAAVYMGSKRFVEEAEFRTSVRKDYGQVAQLIEGTVLADYAPSSWAQHVRIEDDLAEGDAAELISPCPPATFSVGITLPATATDSNMQFFKKFADATTGSTSAPVMATPMGKPNALPSALSLPQPGAAPPTAQLPETVLEPMAEDEEETADSAHVDGFARLDDDCDYCAVDAAYAAHKLLDEHGGADGARWGDASETALLTTWLTAAPPETSLRLLVPAKAARKYEQLLAEYKASQRRGLGDAPTASARRPVAPTRMQAGGRSIIALPEEMLEGAHVEWDVDAQFDERALRERLCQLRVYSAYAQAEIKSIESNYWVAESRAYFGVGGGTVARRMMDRKRLLRQKLLDLDAEKLAVKRRVASLLSRQG